MDYLRGLAKAVLIYAAIALALAATFGLELGAFVLALVTGHAGSGSATEGIWILTFLLMLSAMVGLQRHLPERLKDLMHLHQLNQDGSVPPPEQWFIRALLLNAYVMLTLTQLLLFNGLLAPGTIAVSCFLLILPAVQAIVARGRFSLIDYALFARSAAIEAPQASSGRDARMVVSVAVAAVIALATASFANSLPFMTTLSALHRSNPALLSATLFAAPESADPTTALRHTTVPEVEARIRSVLAGAGLKVIRVALLSPGPAEADGPQAAEGPTVDEWIDIQVALAALSMDSLKQALQDAANRACKSEQAQRDATKTLGVRMRVAGQFDMFSLDVDKPFACTASQAATPLEGKFSVGFSYSLTSGD